MNKFNDVLDQAEKQCEQNSSRLTPKRKKILQELLNLKKHFLHMRSRIFIIKVPMNQFQQCLFTEFWSF